MLVPALATPLVYDTGPVLPSGPQRRAVEFSRDCHFDRDATTIRIKARVAAAIPDTGQGHRRKLTIAVDTARETASAGSTYAQSIRGAGRFALAGPRPSTACRKLTISARAGRRQGVAMTVEPRDRPYVAAAEVPPPGPAGPPRRHERGPALAGMGAAPGPAHSRGPVCG